MPVSCAQIAEAFPQLFPLHRGALATVVDRAVASGVTGGRTTVTDHVRLCSGVQLAGLSAVTKDIAEPGIYAGHPLQPLKAFLRTTASLAHLPGMRKRLADLEQKTGRAGMG